MVDESKGTEPTERPKTAADAAAQAERMVAETARLAAREQEAARFTEKIAHIGSAVNRELSLPAIVDVVLDQTIDTLGARFAHVYRADEEHRRLTLLEHRGLPEDFVQELFDMPFDAPLVAARAASTRTAQLVPSVDRLDPAMRSTRELLARTGCESIAALPLQARGRLIGVLTFAMAGPHDFTSEEAAALDNCAEIFAFAIQNAAAYEEERRLRALFEAVGNATVAITAELELLPVLQNIVDEARRVADAEYAALGIATSPDRPFEPWVFSGMTKEQEEKIGRHPRPVGMLGAVARQGQTIRAADLRRHPAFEGFPEHHPPMTSFLGVPIRHNGRSVGNLYLTNKRGAAAFTLEDERAIELLASHAGAAVYQAALRQQLEAERARFTGIVEHAPYGVAFVEAGTEKVISNRRALELAGQPEIATVAEYRGQVCTPGGKPLPIDEWPPRVVLRGEPFQTQEMLVRGPDGRDVPVLMSAAPVLRRDGGLEGAVVVFEDISELKRLQRLREEWASIVTHDLRQPLNMLTLSIASLTRVAECPDPQRLYKSLDQAQKAASTLSRMIGDLADLSRIETNQVTLERRPLDLESLTRETMERQRAMTPEREIELEVAGSIPEVDADPVRIEQVLGNLLVNALKYSDPGTPIEVVVRALDDEVHVEVTNRGPGIPADDLPRVFDRYFRTARARDGAARGLGLGLHIAKGLMEAHGGRIWAQSRLGQTTTFTFALPVLRDEEPH